MQAGPRSSIPRLPVHRSNSTNTNAPLVFTSNLPSQKPAISQRPDPSTLTHSAYSNQNTTTFPADSSWDSFKKIVNNKFIVLKWCQTRKIKPLIHSLSQFPVDARLDKLKSIIAAVRLLDWNLQAHHVLPFVHDHPSFTFQTAKTLLNTLSPMPQPEIFIYNALIQKMADQHEIGRLLMYMNDEAVKWDMVTLETLIRGCIECDDLEGARRHFDQAGRHDLSPPDVLCHQMLLSAYARKGDHQLVNEILDIMSLSDVALSIDAVRSIVQGFIEVGHLSMARFFLSETTKYGVSPDMGSYNLLIRAYAKSGDMGTCITLLDQMRQHNLPILSNVLSMVLNEYVEVRDTVSAQRLFDYAQSHSLSLSQDCYNVMLKAYWYAKQPHECRRIWTEMRAKNFQNAIGLTSLINAFCEAGNPRQAEEILQDGLSNGIKPDIKLYTAIIRWYNKNHNIASCTRILTAMSVQGLNPDLRTYILMLESYLFTTSPAENLTAALKLFTQLKTHLHPTTHIYTLFISHTLHHNSPLQAEEFLTEALNSPHIKPTDHLFTPLIEYYSHNLDTENTQRIFDLMEHHTLTPTRANFHALLHVNLTTHQFHTSEKIFVKMQQSRSKPTSLTYVMFIDSYEAAEMYVDMRRWMRKMVDDGIANPTPWVLDRRLLGREGKRVVYRRADLFIHTAVGKLKRHKSKERLFKAGKWWWDCKVSEELFGYVCLNFLRVSAADLI